MTSAKTKTNDATLAAGDKAQLYGRYQDHADDVRDHKNKMARWWRAAAHKSIDLADPEDDVQNSVQTTTTNGVGWKELALVGAMTSGLGAGGYLLGVSNNQPAPVPVVAPETQQTESTIDTDTDTRSTTRLRMFPG